jgi:peptidoglycan lytic transglycosylase G
VVERREGVMPPRQRPPRRTPRSVVYRRRLAAVAVLVVAIAAVWFIVSSVKGGNGTTTQATVPVAAPKPFRIVFPEGFTRAQMAKRVAVVSRIAQKERGKKPKLKAATYLAATKRQRFIPGFGKHPLEGFLFPATYDFTGRTTSAQLANRQLQAFQRNWSQLNLAYARSKNLTPYDVLIIASMVEEETAAPEERQLVSAVIYNRLHDRMALGIDATLRYGLHIPPTESIHQSQLETSNPYNTSALGGHTGLPPTPIGNPGLASLQAAAHPAHVNFLYFVRKPDKKHHFFTDSLAAFNAYKAAHGYP